MEVRAERMVAGGLALSRDDDGRVVLVAGALPGELVEVSTHQHHGATQGDVVTVLEPSPDRVDPPCPFVADGCGGCDWQHATPGLQSEMRLEIVRDALRRLARLSDPTVRPGPPVDPDRSRNALRVAVVDGQLGLRRRSSHDVVPIDDCLVVAPALAELLVPGAIDPGDAESLTLRIGEPDGEVLVIAEPTADGVTVPEGVLLVGGDELQGGKRVWFHTTIAGHRFRVSARSFLQVRTDGAEALVAVVRDQLADAPPGPFVDLYGGIGLFAVTAAGERDVLVVERSRSAVADARVNLADRPARVVACPVEKWRPSPAAVVVADPAREGLGRSGVAKAAATDAERVVLVSCDAGSLGRDVRDLTKAGYRHVESVVVDLFGHTGHVEVVTRFDHRDSKA